MFHFYVFLKWNYVPWKKGKSLQPLYYLVVSTHLKNISQIESFPQERVNIKNVWNPHPVILINER